MSGQTCATSRQMHEHSAPCSRVCTAILVYILNIYCINWVRQRCRVGCYRWAAVGRRAFPAWLLSTTPVVVVVVVRDVRQQQSFGMHTNVAIYTTRMHLHISHIQLQSSQYIVDTFVYIRASLLRLYGTRQHSHTHAKHNTHIGELSALCCHWLH